MIHPFTAYIEVYRVSLYIVLILVHWSYIAPSNTQLLSNLLEEKKTYLQFSFYSKTTKTKKKNIQCKSLKLWYIHLYLIEWVKDFIHFRFHHDSLVVLGRITVILSRDDQIVYCRGGRVENLLRSLDDLNEHKILIRFRVMLINRILGDLFNVASRDIFDWHTLTVKTFHNGDEREEDEWETDHRLHHFFFLGSFLFFFSRVLTVQLVLEIFIDRFGQILPKDYIFHRHTCN